MRILICLALAVPGAALAEGNTARASVGGPCGLYEAVEPGDTLSAIGQRCGVPVERLVAINDIDPRAMQPGQVVRLSERAALPLPAARETVVIDEDRRRFPVSVVGKWREAGVVCDSEAGIWQIGEDAISFGGVRYEVTGADMDVIFMRGPDGDTAISVRRTGERTLQVRGAGGIDTELLRCGR